MSKTFDQSLIDTCIISMSMLDKEDIIQVGSDEYESLRREQQGCHNELTSRYDYPFKIAKKIITTQSGLAQYDPIMGRIKDVYITINGNKTQLSYNKNGYLNIDKTGQPTEFWEDYNPDKFVLYPTPDSAYTITVTYYNSANVLDAEGNGSFTISAGSTLSMPERLQHLYFDALEYFLLATHLRKNTNPRYQPTLEEFKDKWNVFLSQCGQTTTSTGFII